MNTEQANQLIVDRYGIDLNQKSPHYLKHSRWKEFPEILKALDLKVGAEIGVFRGQFTEILCRAGFNMFAIDPWEIYPNYNDYETEIILSAKREALKRIEKYNCEVIQEYSCDAVKHFEDESLDFVFIDGNHALEYVIEDVANWSKKVRPGGIVAGHDYFRTKNDRIHLHVKDAINVWTFVYKISPWFVLANDKCPTWFYVKGTGGEL